MQMITVAGTADWRLRPASSGPQAYLKGKRDSCLLTVALGMWFPNLSITLEGSWVQSLVFSSAPCLEHFSNLNLGICIIT